jgi:chemotaxis protein methyltransferase CheR
MLHEPSCLERLLLGLCVNVSAMFRDPRFFLTFRQRAIPLLRTYPFIRIWQAGCSMGEEVYSLAILLQEEGLYDRCRIYATDMNEVVLRKARDGIYPLDVMQKYTANYLAAGGTGAFSDYYTAAYEHVILRSSLRDHVIFSQHNLVSDGVFNEFNVILCRNVMIYFTRALQERVQDLFSRSLARFGLIGLGSHESLRFLPGQHEYEPLEAGEKLFRRAR